jgi:transcriptional regulator of arginine metabolism
MNIKTARQKMITEIIGRNRISFQEEIIEQLAAAGFECTQATLSRDLAFLGVRKLRDEDGLFYSIPKSSMPTILSSGIISVRLAANIAVIACEPGSAPAVCVRIDSMNLPEAVGTIAGDDTIFVACESPEAAKRFAAKFKNLM